MLKTREPSPFARLLCRLFGHRWTVTSISGRFQWCDRCAQRREVRKAA